MWKLLTLPYISFSSIIKELYKKHYLSNNSLKELFILLSKKKRSQVASLNTSLVLHLANDCLPINYNSFYDINDPNLFQTEHNNLDLMLK